MTEQILALRRTGGYLALENLSALAVSGTDAAVFLQARLSNDVASLQPGDGQRTSLLDRQAHVLALFSLYRLDNSYLLLLDRSLQEKVLEQLEKFHFREKVSFRRLEQYVFWTVQGPKSMLLLQKLANGVQPPVKEYCAAAMALPECSAPGGILVFNCTLTGETGFVLALDKQYAQAAQEKLETAAQALQIVALDESALNVARIEAGIPLYNQDVSEVNLLPETGLEHSTASYTKGCFQGQEVLARTRTYGAPRRGLVGLKFKDRLADDVAVGSPLALSGTQKEMGSLCSHAFSPTLDCCIALAYVSRDYRVPDRAFKLTIAGKDYDTTIVALPFYDQALRRKQAQSVYKAALAEFATGSEHQAITMLKESIGLDPLFDDAYESLGVILSRNDQVEEAIYWMKQLEQLDPESVMAHTNLSVFYMQQGDKEAAEEEKARALSISMSKIARTMVADQAEAEAAIRRKAEAQERLGLFQQVLAIDPHDYLANAGLGGAYVDLEQYAESVPFLEKALAAKPDQTLAYLSLGKAYQQLNRLSEAASIFEKGLVNAAKKGEITPLKELQQSLDQLRSRAGS